MYLNVNVYPKSMKMRTKSAVCCKTS